MYLGILDIFAGSDVFRYCQAKNDIQKKLSKISFVNYGMLSFLFLLYIFKVISFSKF